MTSEATDGTKSDTNVQSRKTEGRDCASRFGVGMVGFVKFGGQSYKKK
jgi:hypothetical protein